MLLQVSEGMPVVFEWDMVPAEFTGEELNLTPLGEKNKYPKGETFKVFMPAMVAVDHRQQVKDAYKLGGWPAVKQYHTSVINKIQK